MEIGSESLLGELALRLAKSPEDVATEGLAYVLSRSGGAYGLIQQLADEWSGHPVRPIISFKSQVVGADSARPDLEAQDADGVPVVIFEDKFWASLTDGQPVTYLSRLEEMGGVLCFVVPTSRTVLLWGELVRRTQASGLEVDLIRDEAELKVGRIGSDRSLVLTSWSFLLGQVRTALEANGDARLLSDLRQVVGLAARMETSGFVPFALSDLTAPTPRHVVQMCELVDTAVGRALEEPFASKKGLKATAGSGWYGHYLWIHGCGCQLSFNARMWNRFGRSPLWLWVRDSEFKPSEELERALVANYGRDECIVLLEGWGAGGVWLAVPVLEGGELGEVVEDVLRQLSGVAEVLSVIRHGEPTGTPGEAGFEIEAD